jgi:uncharacterized membrane protein YfcA
MELVDITWYQYVFIAIAGVLTGIINTLAGSGSLVTLPIFILLCGLPATVANGTNRIGALMQSIVGVYAYRKTGQTDFAQATWPVVASVAGGIGGALLATQMDKQMMYTAIGVLMVFMLFVLMFNPKRWLRETEADAARNRHPMTLLMFFGIGIYGGFIQAGIGIFLLAALVLGARYSLVAANGIKLLVVLVLNIPTLIIFFYYNQVHLGWGIFMAVAQSVGAWIGVHFVARMPNANVWIHRLLIVIVVASAIKFLGLWDWLMGMM